MKVKSDFVTNSSSSSFVAMGVYVDGMDIPDECWDKIVAKLSNGEELTVDDVVNNFTEYLDDLLVDTGLQYSGGYEYSYETAMIGIPYSHMKEDETLGEFRERVKTLIQGVFGFVAEVGHIQECWMNN